MLYELQQSQSYEVTELLVTMTENENRVNIHGIPKALLEKQAASLGLPLVKMCVPQYPSNELYEARWGTLVLNRKKAGIKTVAFGDIFLRDIRAYRENQAARFGVTPIFPIWKKDTDELIHKFIEEGFKAVVTCVNPKVLDPSFARRTIDEQFLQDLPEDVNPCGENGEYHSFVYDGPIFANPIPFSVSPSNIEDSFYHYCELREI